MINLSSILAQAALPSKPDVPFGSLDIILFCVAVVLVIGLGIWKSRDEDSDGEKSASDYFLAGRGLTWWLVGFSLIAANISTEQFVGMSGQAADWLGMAIASYEWIAAITLVVVAFCFLPKLLRGGVYTIPEFLEYRYNSTARAIMAVATLLILVGVPTAGVIYSGAKVITVFFAGTVFLGIDFGSIVTGCIFIAASGAIYVYIGGLKACAWTDLIWGAALIAGGGVVAYLAMQALGTADPQTLFDTKVATSSHTLADIEGAGALDRFLMLNWGDAAEGANGAGGKLHMIRPATDSAIPWTALCLGLWIPNFFYWGLNQYIMQRTLASKSLAEGQIGIVFAAFLKLIIPFVVVIPGILAYNLYSGDLRREAMTKHTEEVSLLTKEGKLDSTVIVFTDGFVLENHEDAKRYMQKNAQLASGSPEDIVEMNSLFVKFQEDVDNPQTNRTNRIGLANDITKINTKFIDTAKAQKIPLSNKLVGYDYDSAFPTLLHRLLQPGTSWFVLAALFGAVVSSLASMLNSASTIFTMDIYHRFRKNALPSELVKVGKIGVLICVGIALVIAPQLGNPKFGGIFTFIQEFQGFLSPGALCVFLFGFFVTRCPRNFGWIGIAANGVIYSLLLIFLPEMPFLNRMSISFIAILLVGAGMTVHNIVTNGEVVVLPENGKVDLDSSPKAKLFGWGVVIVTIALYIKFW